jgi:hypothetical protein
LIVEHDGLVHAAVVTAAVGHDIDGPHSQGISGERAWPTATYGRTEFGELLSFSFFGATGSGVIPPPRGEQPRIKAKPSTMNFFNMF